MTPTNTPADAWARLPNAVRVDRVLDHVRRHPQTWDAARDAAGDAARDAARGAAWGAARGAAWGAAWGAARGAAWDAVICLIAYDDLGYLLDEDTPEHVVRAIVAMDDRAMLLTPALRAMRGITP